MGMRLRSRRRLDAIAERGGLKSISQIEGPVSSLTRIAGVGNVRMFASNDYLGLANHPTVVAAAKAAMDRFGAGAGGARFICGTTTAHVAFERELAAFLGYEAAVTLSSGFAANVALISVLTEPGDVILSDALNHASLIDGCRMAPKGVRTVVYPHGDLDEVARLLESLDDVGCRFIVTDGVFSMEGDLAPMRGLASLASRHDAILVVDDAHGIGVLGPRGAGVIEHFDVRGDVSILTGSLGKALGGAAGGFVAGPSEVIEVLTQSARPQLFSTALPAASICASHAALGLLANNPEMVHELGAKAAWFRASLSKNGVPVPEGETPIVPVMIGSSTRARKLNHRLLNSGVYGAEIAFPAVPEGKARIRLQVSRNHSLADLDEATEIIASALAALDADSDAE